MKKLTFLICVVVLFSCGSGSQTLDIDPSIAKNNFSALENFDKLSGGADILFNEYEFQFPDMEKGDVLEHTFYFVNNGDKPLILTNVKGSCGCTNVEYPDQPILPGEKGAILAEINTEGKKPNKIFRVAVQVQSNAISKKVKLWLKGIPYEEQ
jgi:hypothetical protein